MEKVLTRSDIVEALNEWMRRFVEEPNRFEHEWETVYRFQQDRLEGDGKPTYGETCSDYLFKIHKELQDDVDIQA